MSSWGRCGETTPDAISGVTLYLVSEGMTQRLKILEQAMMPLSEYTRSVPAKRVIHKKINGTLECSRDPKISGESGGFDALICQQHLFWHAERGPLGAYSEPTPPKISWQPCPYCPFLRALECKKSVAAGNTAVGCAKVGRRPVREGLVCVGLSSSRFSGLCCQVVPVMFWVKSKLRLVVVGSVSFVVSR